MIRLAANLPTIAIAAVLAVLVVLAAVYIIRQHKKGKCVGCPAEHCSCQCDHCAQEGACHKEN